MLYHRPMIYTGCTKLIINRRKRTAKHQNASVYGKMQSYTGICYTRDPYDSSPGAPELRLPSSANWKHVVLFIIEASSDLRHTAAPLVEHAQSECAVGKHGGSHEYDRKYRLFCHFSTLYIDEVHF